MFGEFLFGTPYLGQGPIVINLGTGSPRVITLDAADNAPTVLVADPGGPKQLIASDTE